MYREEQQPVFSVNSMRRLETECQRVSSVPASCGRPVAGCVRGSSLALRFLGSADPSVSWTGPQTHNQNQRVTWTHTQTAPAAEDMFKAFDT